LAGHQAPRKTRRTNYTAADMQEAVRLVKVEGYTIKRASKAINMVKENEVPRMTLSDCLKRGAGIAEHQ
jgi:hypothetical protein